MADLWERTLKVWDMETLVCDVCGKKFKQSGNIGRWECVMKVSRQNPVTRAFDVHLVRCDHRVDKNQSYYPLPIIEIPRSIFKKYRNVLQPRNDAIVHTNHADIDPSLVRLVKNQGVRRFDEKTAEIFANQPAGCFRGLRRIHCGVPQKILKTTFLLEKSSI